MARGRAYTVDTGSVALTSTAQTPILLMNTGATVTADLIAIRGGIASGASVAYPTNGSVTLLLARAANTPVGTTTITPRPGNVQDIAANTLAYSAWSTAPTVGPTLWGQNIPFSAGGNWGEVFDRDLERRLGGAGASAWWALFATLSASSTATNFEFWLDFVE
jgi:hypothetical protein